MLFRSTVTQPNVAVPAMCTLLLTFVIAHPYKVSYKTNNPFVFQELLTHNASGKYSKVSIEISINMLIMLLQQVLVICTGTINKREHEQGWVHTTRVSKSRDGHTQLSASMNELGHCTNECE